MGKSTQQNDANGGTPLAEPTGSAFDPLELNRSIGKAYGLLANLDTIAERMMKRKNSPLWLFTSLGLAKKTANELATTLEKHKNELSNRSITPRDAVVGQ